MLLRDQIIYTYIGSFNRIPTKLEIDWWQIYQYSSNVKTAEMLFKVLKSTPEGLTNLTDDSDLNGLVADLYNHLFDRSINAGSLTQAEIDYWVESINDTTNGVTKDTILLSMVTAGLQVTNAGPYQNYLLDLYTTAVAQGDKAVTDVDVIYAYLAALGRGPTELEMHNALNEVSITDKETLFAFVRTTEVGKKALPEEPLNLVSIIYRNLFNMQYSQANKYIEYYVDKIEDLTFNINNIYIEIINNPREYQYTPVAGENEEDLVVVSKKEKVLGYVFTTIDVLTKKFNEAYVQLYPEYTIDENGNIIDRTIVADPDISIEQITNNVVVENSIVTGDGIFDKMMETLNIHIDNQFQLNRIKGAEYANVYSTFVTTAMQLSFNMAIQEKVNEEGMKLTRANIELTKRKSI